MCSLRIGSLFSGIGGLELGLEKAGLGETVWQSEIDPYCSGILAEHWPGVPNLGDIREITDPPAVDLLCGGFPCQPVSSAGKRLAQDDPRWLWPEFQRIIELTRPSFVVAENVPGLRTRGLGLVLQGLADVGYDAEWIRLSAAAVGAPHLRERLFIVAYPQSSERNPEELSCVAEAGERTPEPRECSSSSPLADTNGSRWVWGSGNESQENRGEESQDGSSRSYWEQRPLEPGVRLVAHGVPSRLARLAAAGNAVVPQCSEFIGLCIKRAIGG